MSFKTALKSLTIVTMTALSLAACGSSNGKGNPTTDSNSPTTTGPSTGAGGSCSIGTNPADPNGGSVLSTSSCTVADTASNGNITLPYVIFAQNANATDSNKIYGIQFSDYDPCTQGSEYGWNTFPGTQSYSVLGFYFPSAPAAQSYTIGTDIVAADAGFGEKFVAQPQNANGIACKATTWAQVTGGTVQVSAADGTTVTGVLSLTLGDGSTISGNFQSGTCSATATGSVSNPNAAGQCNSEN